MIDYKCIERRGDRLLFVTFHIDRSDIGGNQNADRGDHVIESYLDIYEIIDGISYDRRIRVRLGADKVK